MKRALFVLIGIGAGASVFASPQGTAKRPLAIEDYYQVQTIGGMRWSPDGKTITFSVSTRVEECNATRTETFTIPVDGSAPPVKVEAPSEGGGAGRGGRAGGLGAAGGGLASPDGTVTLIARDLPRPAAPAVEMTDFEKRHMDRFKGATFDWKDFQRDGQAFPAPNLRARPGQQLVVQPSLSKNGGETRVLTTEDLRPANMVWHPNGRLIAFVADPDWRNELKYDSPDLYTVTTDGVLTRVTNDGYVYSDLEFSPDGKYLAYARTFGTDMVIDQKLNHGGPRDLFARPMTSGSNAAPINLTANWDLEPGDARFSPDGAFLYFSAGIGGETHLFKVSVPGGVVTQITNGPRRLAGFSYDTAMTKVAYTASTHDSPGELFVANIDGSGERQLTRVLSPFLDSIAFGKTDRLEWASKDGTKIEGWLTHPTPGKQPAAGATAPLIVFSHGGPHAATGYSFDFKKQFFAAQGYFVLDTNFRSSTNYGEAFKWATWGAWGDKDGEDVMAGIDYVIARYPINPQKVGHTGHSYGGFMTNWLITQYPDRFAAAITGAGITNWISDYGTADIYRTKETEFFGTPWEPAARDRMIRQSPLTYAGRVKTPTLFVHGEVDQRVPYEEGEQMYFALKRRGVPAKMIQYAGQPHGIAGHWNNVHRILSELSWWKTYMRP
jgi:dipeptidyl aminopeptidase/acylaminoacyl peptidase